MGSDPCQPSRCHYMPHRDSARLLATAHNSTHNPSNSPDLKLDRTPELRRDVPEDELKT
jgi:hypothetical protein